MDAVTEATRDNVGPHLEKLDAALTEVLNELAALQRHARRTEKPKWARLQTKAHRLINDLDRVRTGT